MGMFDAMFGQNPDIRSGTMFAPAELPMFGAKPLVGTPPFAPPHPQTGGAEIPTTPGTLPGKHGFAGFMDRFIKNGSLGDIGAMIGTIGTGNLSQVIEQINQRHAADRQRQEQAGQYQQHRQDEMSDWQAKEDYRFNHQAPDKPTGYAADLLMEGVDPTSPEGRARLHTYNMNREDGIVTVPFGNGQTYMGPRSGMPAALGAPQQDAPSGRPSVGSVVTDLPPETPHAGNYGAFKNAIIGQESGGRYGVANTDGSGAMGVGQIMPGTAKVLAGRLGLPYNPGLLAGNDPNARAYQDKLTEAAVQEAWNSQGGDPRAAAMYYFGGSNRGGWKDKTHRYADDILKRMRG